MSTCVHSVREENQLHRRSFGRAMHWDADLPCDLVEQLWRDPHSLLTGGLLLQDKPRCTTVRIDHPQGAFFIKHHNWGGPIRTLKKSLRRPPAKQCWLDGRHLHAAGVPTPRPRSYLVRRVGPIGVCSYLLTDYLEGTTLYRFMRFDRPTPNAVLGVAQQVAAIWQQLDDLLVSHNDLKTENFMIDRSGRVWLIDLEKMRRHRSRDEVRTRQKQDAVRFLHSRNWRADPAAAEVFRQQILQTPSTADLVAFAASDTHPLKRPVQATNHSSQLVSVLIPCRNDAQVIADCLHSVRDIADEILVADAGSTDNSLKIVRAMGGCKIVERACADEVEFANWAHHQAQHPWILRVLPNERVSAELAKEVQGLLATEPLQDGFRITLRFYFWGRLVKFGGFRNHSSLRLYRRNVGHYAMREGRTEVVVPSQNIGHMDSKILYETCWSIEQYIQEMTRAAARRADHAHRDCLHPKCRTELWQTPWQFVRSYFLQLGFLDGRAGFHASWLSALAVYLRETKLWEIDKIVSPRQVVIPESLQGLKLFESDVPDAAGAPITLPFAHLGDETAATAIPEPQQHRAAAC